MIDGYGELEFDLPGALLTAILDRLSEVTPADLIIANTSKIPEEQGVYTLYRKSDQKLVYIGKTDSKAGLRHRLTRHSKKIDGRRKITPEDVQFKAIRLFVFTAMDLESALINNYGGVQGVPWNHSGFGSNDPGKERDTTHYKPDHFDTQYPIRLDEAFVKIPPGEYRVAEIMKRLKQELPFLLRFFRPGKSRTKFHKDFEATLKVTREGMTTRELLTLCMEILPSGWHSTALPSHIISYKNDNRSFPSGEEIARS